MTDTAPSFAFSIETDAYSTAGKIMGRQMAGRGFLRGMGRTWPNGTLRGVGTGQFNREETLQTLRDSGFAGELLLSYTPAFKGACELGALYYPTIPISAMAHLRNRLGPAAFSLFGVTHTISSNRALDGIAALASGAFMPWDALICTSDAAKVVVDGLLEETREDLRRNTGASNLPAIQTPVIPLGVHCHEWAPDSHGKARARAALGLAADEVAFLFAGRLSFHAKANPAPLYQALQAASGDAKLVLIEAGLFPHPQVGDAFAQAQAALAPDVRFLHVPGDDAGAYADAWRAADVFVSLSDNIQETFGLTPVEAMAAGLPVLVSDWNGYRSNIRHGVEGFLIPTIAAPPGAGPELALAVETGHLSYDRQIGLASLAVAVARQPLHEALTALATDADLRQRMGAAGRSRALEIFDWPVVLGRYDALARELNALRPRGDAAPPPRPWRERADPFARFQGFATRGTADADTVRLHPEAEAMLAQIAALDLANYSFDQAFLEQQAIGRLVDILRQIDGAPSVATLLREAGGASPRQRRALAWLFKFGIVEIDAP